MPSRIVIADDHPLVLKGLSDFLIEKGHEVLGSAKNGKQALELIESQNPEVAILDIRMPFFSGLEIAETLQRKKHPTKVVLITFEKDPNLIDQAKAYDVRGFILKEFALNEIESCLDALENEGQYFSPNLSQQITDSNSLDLSVLSVTERKIVKHIANNKTNKEIGEIMFISHRTVEKHRSNIIKKLELEQHQNSLLIWAKEHQHYFI